MCTINGNKNHRLAGQLAGLGIKACGDRDTQLLEHFLAESALATDAEQVEADDDAVSLMTLHAAKGLEFPSVYIIAVEDGILPHSRSQSVPDMVEEERRLLFVEYFEKAARYNRSSIAWIAA